MERRKSSAKQFDLYIVYTRPPRRPSRRFRQHIVYGMRTGPLQPRVRVTLP